jgi:osomolarity two-component system sensor histidine kinase SLN1
MNRKCRFGRDDQAVTAFRRAPLVSSRLAACFFSASSRLSFAVEAFVSMPFWSTQDQSAGYSASSKWTEEVSMPTLRRTFAEKGHVDSSTSMPTPATSTAVDSLPIPVLQNTGTHSVSSRRKKKSARIGGLSVHWAKFKRRVGTGTAPSSSSLIGESAAESSYTRRMEASANQGDSEEVNEVVVDRIWSEEIKSSVSHSEHGASPEKSGGSHPIQPSSSDHDSVAQEGFWGLTTPLIFLRWRLWPVIVEIFSSRFVDDKSEQHYALVTSEYKILAPF